MVAWEIVDANVMNIIIDHMHLGSLRILQLTSRVGFLGGEATADYVEYLKNSFGRIDDEGSCAQWLVRAEKLVGLGERGMAVSIYTRLGMLQRAMRIVQVDLERCNGVGSVPHEYYSEDWRIRRIRLRGSTGRKISQLPASLMHVSSLRQLELCNHMLSALPAEVGQLYNLEKLELHNNLLSSVPSELGQLSNLQMLSLCHNRLMHVPAELGQLSNLRVLQLSNNWLTSLPAELGQLSSLQMLHASNNWIASVPEEFGQLCSLQILGLGNNCLSSVPAELGQLRRLQCVYLSNNWITSLPVELEQLCCYIERHNNQAL